MTLLNSIQNPTWRAAPPFGKRIQSPKYLRRHSVAFDARGKVKQWKVNNEERSISEIERWPALLGFLAS
jgi:hypothetical protein